MTVRLDPQVEALIEDGTLDLEDPRHREAYLRAWVAAPRCQGDDGREYPASVPVRRTG